MTKVLRLIATILLFAGVAVGLWVTLAPHFVSRPR
jgi:hypothetical protein